MSTMTPDKETAPSKKGSEEEQGAYYQPHRRSKGRKAFPVADFTADYRDGATEPVKREPKQRPEPTSFSMDYREEGQRGQPVVGNRDGVNPGENIGNGAEPLAEEEESLSNALEDSLFGGLPVEPDPPAATAEGRREEPEDLHEELEEASQGPTVVLRPHVRRRAGHRRYGVAVGTLVLLLALVGVVFLAVSLGQAIHGKVTDDSYLRDYDRFLAPVVMQDPVPFESAQSANGETVLTASLWRAIFSKGGEGYTSYDQQGRSLVPLADVQAACLALFGPDCALQPQTPAEETFFTYSAQEQQFHVAPYSTQSAYSAYTESAKKSGDTTVLRVGYVSPADPYRESPESGAKPSPVKYMDYILKENPETKDFYIYAIRSAQ